MIWDIEEGKYDEFHALWGKGSWGHSQGAPVSLTIAAINAEGTETILTTSRFVAFGEEAIHVSCEIPLDAVQIKAICHSETGIWASCSSIMAEAVLYETFEGDGWTYGPCMAMQYFEIFDEETTEEETEEPDTTVAGTNAPATNDGESTPTTEKTEEKGGCGSMMGFGALVLAACLAAPVAFKKH